MVLHTWTRELTFHPHVHAIVSAGALSPDGVWLESRKDYLFPVKVMARLFRRLFREALLKAIEAGEVSVVAEQQAAMRRALLETKWHVYAKAPFGGAEQVYSYLGRYTHRVGISNARILRADEHAVTFATKNGRTCTVTPVEFLRRFLLHVLPRGFHKLRHYGLCSSHHIAQGTIGIVRNILGSPTTGAAPGPTAGHDLPTVTVMPDSTPPQTWVECMIALTGIDVLRCPRCSHGRMLRVALELASGPPHPDTS
jgi:hypothetical protein